MKIGIMTFPNSTSFGASLQMYALYRAVERLDVQAEIINYHNAYMKAERHTSAMQGNKKLKKIRLWAKHMLHFGQIQKFRRFERSMPCYPKRPICQKQKLRQLSDRYDGVICGSDQVWNPNITDTDMSFFLDFCGENTKRISYAPSFGITEFTEEFQNSIQKELHTFHALSVRETEGQQLLHRLMQKQVPVVLDPTFLLDKGDWTALEKPHAAAKEGYILYYTVRSSKSLLRFCLDLADKTHKKVVIVGGNFLRQLGNRDKRICYARDIGPEQWLYLMHHAQYVVTNSFHGTAFAIHYQKDFFLEYSSTTNSRLQQIIGAAKLENRVVGPNVASWDEKIDYTWVESSLEHIKTQSVSYLKEAIGQ